ncbi:ankyrin and armadillo repeat-containing protein [Plakobranchus ocellatus]|uniref:Ankyrin and armadillo repeat-containing protein n=1 Tax=Plakobranchus ocellatus TaxID=259542 RepID=A0AAV3ZE37_9GAST|nr:ankyrin and armadillo repeat-containing protein [Plakobranchus ocellatus]
MNEPDENGWSHIHQCAFRGFVKSLERFVENDRDLLELETADDLRQTPFLLAISSGLQDTVACLIDMGAKTNVTNSQNHGAVEICAIKEFISLLRYLISRDLSNLPVWKNLLKMMSSDLEEEAEAAGKCLRTLTDRSEELGINPDWRTFYDNGGVPTVVKVAKNTMQDYAKIPAFQTLLNIIEMPEVKDQLVSSGGVPAFVKLLKSTNTFAVQLSAQIIKDVAEVPAYAETVSQNQAVPNLLKVLQTVHDPEVLIPVVEAVGTIALASPKLRSAVGSAQGMVQSLVSLFDTNNHPGLLLALTNAVSQIVEGDKANQNAFVAEGITQHIVSVVMNQIRNKDIQASAVEAIHKLADSNKQTQKDLLDKGAERLLMQMLKKNRAEALQEKTAMALWALAGDNIDEKREMAGGIGVQMLIEFVNSMSENLHYIGSEGLGVLAQGPLNQQSVIAQANGIHPLVRLMKSNKESIVLSVIKTLRHLCVGVGKVPHERNQNTISQSRGIKFLIALMVHSANEVVQVEAAFTLGCVSLGNKDILEEIFQNADFSYVRILKMLYAREPLVRMLAGSALAAFAYNNLQQQKEIAEQGGVRFSCFVPFLQSDDEYFRCCAAYQVVILARIIPDEEQAKSSAAGIKLLVDLLQDSRSEEVQALAADCVASLTHTRAGVAAAIVAINAVDHLCQMLLSEAEQVRGTAAIALGYLSHDHKGERLILQRCRTDPYLMKVIRYYTKRIRLAPTFTEGWQHYRKVGLPPIPEGRPSLVRRRSQRDDARPITILSFEESSTARGSNSHEDGETSSRSSRATNHHESLHNSRLSLTSQRSQMSRVSLVHTGEEG